MAVEARVVDCGCTVGLRKHDRIESLDRGCRAFRACCFHHPVAHAPTVLPLYFVGRAAES